MGIRVGVGVRGWVIGLLCFGGRLCLVLVVIVFVICCYGSMYVWFVDWDDRQ